MCTQTNKHLLTGSCVAKTTSRICFDFTGGRSCLIRWINRERRRKTKRNCEADCKITNIEYCDCMISVYKSANQNCSHLFYCILSFVARMKMEESVQIERNCTLQCTCFSPFFCRQMHTVVVDFPHRSNTVPFFLLSRLYSNGEEHRLHMPDASFYLWTPGKVLYEQFA